MAVVTAEADFSLLADFAEDSLAGVSAGGFSLFGAGVAFVFAVVSGVAFSFAAFFAAFLAITSLTRTVFVLIHEPAVGFYAQSAAVKGPQARFPQSMRGLRRVLGI
ncbi:MAG TPA: hypothetical protein PK992_02655 [Planctomycetaceae bacterium]|nr:hypothetical protein [Planctomycetaceae bacterium]